MERTTLFAPDYCLALDADERRVLASGHDQASKICQYPGADQDRALDFYTEKLGFNMIGHDQQPAAFLVYLYLSGRAARQHWQPVKSSLRMLADETGLSKSAVQSAIAKLQYRQLIKTSRAHRTAVPAHRVLRHWRSKPPGSAK